MAKANHGSRRLPNAAKIQDAVEALAAPKIVAMGYELCEVEYALEEGNNVLTFYIYRPEGVSLDDCEAVSNMLDPLLDEADPIAEPYYLSVSSLGLDRPLKKPRDYERRVGSEVKIGLFAPLDGKKSFAGTLQAADESGFVLLIGGKERRFEYKAVASARPEVKF